LYNELKSKVNVEHLENIERIRSDLFLLLETIVEDEDEKLTFEESDDYRHFQTYELAFWYTPE
jgi:hypothetical protein